MRSGFVEEKKWQMLVFSAIANVAATLNLVFLGEMGSAAIINLVATLQVFISLSAHTNRFAAIWSEGSGGSCRYFCW